MSRRFLAIVGAVYLALCGLQLQRELTQPIDQTFSNDAASYDAAAVQLARTGLYSLDGQRPYAEREPGLSIFYAAIYWLFGAQNRFALFAAQLLLYGIAVLWFASQTDLGLETSERKAFVTLMLLLPAVLHTLFLPLRESLTSSLMLVAASLFFSLVRRPAWSLAVALGILWAAICLTYLPFLFFPAGVVLLAMWEKVPWSKACLVALIPALAALGWMGRNQSQTDRFELTSNWRATAIIYARAEQAKQVRGLAPVECLVAEYVTRDWTGLPRACSLNGVINAKWPNRVPTPDDDTIRRESVATIIAEWPHYLWFSAFEVVEFHLPFVGGRGFLFNVWVSLGTGIVYLGVGGSLFAGSRRVYRYLVPLALYTMAIFAVFDATPRYRMPILFCYVVPASVGLVSLGRRLRAWLK